MSERSFAPGPDELEFTTPDGAVRAFPAKYDPDESAPTGASGPTADRVVILGEGWAVHQRRLRAGAATAAARDMLDAEICAGVLLYQRFGGERYPDVLPRLVGYDAEDEEPFVLYEPVPGRPAADVAGALGISQLNEFSQSLFRALRLLSAVGLVHRGITPQSVLWDGSAARLANLATVGFVGQARRRLGTEPWAPPEQTQGKGTVHPGDDVWSVAKLIVHMNVGPGRPLLGKASAHRIPLDPPLQRLLDGAFQERAADRPDSVTLLNRARGADPLREVDLAPDPLEEARRVVDELLERAGTDAPGEAGGPFDHHYDSHYDNGYGERHDGRFDAGRSRWPRRGRNHPAAPRYAPPEPVGIQCPYCLDPIAYNPNELYARDAQRQYQPLTVQPEWNEKTRRDILRTAYQRCPNSSDIAEHFLATEYLTHGPPLTIAMIGQSKAGKTHLLVSMIAEIEDGALAPYGITHRAVNPEEHAAFLRTHVAGLRGGRVLPSTAETNFPVFEDALLLTRGGVTRPLAFFDLAGENLVRTDAATRFLAGVGGLLFVVDPARAVRLPATEEARRQLGLWSVESGDPTFGTVLDRVQGAAGSARMPAAIAVAKSDLIRHEPPVARWLGDEARTEIRRDDRAAETRDVLAFLRTHGAPGWTRPAIDCRACTAHFVTATGAATGPVSVFGAAPQGSNQGSGAGSRPRRVLEPLLSIFAMSGFLDEPVPAPEYPRRGRGY